MHSRSYFFNAEKLSNDSENAYAAGATRINCNNLKTLRELYSLMQAALPQQWNKSDTHKRFDPLKDSSRSVAWAFRKHQNHFPKSHQQIFNSLDIVNILQYLTANVGSINAA